LVFRRQLTLTPLIGGVVAAVLSLLGGVGAFFYWRARKSRRSVSSTAMRETAFEPTPAARGDYGALPNFLDSVSGTSAAIDRSSVPSVGTPSSTASGSPASTLKQRQYKYLNGSVCYGGGPTAHTKRVAKDAEKATGTLRRRRRWRRCCVEADRRHTRGHVGRWRRRRWWRTKASATVSRGWRRGRGKTSANRQRQPHVFLILFSVWKPIKKENSRVSSTEIKNSEISLFPFSFRDSTMSSSSSSLSEKKKPPPVVDSDAAVPTASVPASAPSEPKPTESVPASAPSEPTKKKRVRQARQAQAVPGYGDVNVTDLKPDRTEVFKLGWHARRVLHAAAAEPQAAEPSAPHAPIELRRDGSLDDSVIASLQRVAAQRPVAIEGLNNFHEAVEVLVGELLDGKMGSDDKVALLRDRLDKLHKASPKSAGSARAGAAAKGTGNVYIQGSSLALQKARGKKKDETFWPELFDVIKPAEFASGPLGQAQISEEIRRSE
jgi:hypothetical protein